MHHKTIYVIHTILLFSFLGCCEGKVDLNRKNDVLLRQTKMDTSDKNLFVKDIPTSKRGYYPGYTFIEKIISLSGMTDIDNGYDSIYIRLWYSYSFESGIQCISIKKRDSHWEAEYDLLEQIWDAKDSLISIKRNSVQKVPKSGWESFIEKLLEKNITTLPHEWSIPASAYTPTDGDGVGVEIATKKLYRTYSYYSPRWYGDVKEAQAMVEIMELIESEFDIKKIREF